MVYGERLPISNQIVFLCHDRSPIFTQSIWMISWIHDDDTSREVGLCPMRCSRLIKYCNVLTQQYIYNNNNKSTIIHQLRDGTAVRGWVYCYFYQIEKKFNVKVKSSENAKVGVHIQIWLAVDTVVHIIRGPCTSAKTLHLRVSWERIACTVVRLSKAQSWVLLRRFVTVRLFIVRFKYVQWAVSDCLLALITVSRTTVWLSCGLLCLSWPF